MKDRYDPVYGVTYKAMCCINNDDLNERCKVKDANKVVYAIKASPKLNNDMYLSLRAALQNGYMELLSDENGLEYEWDSVIKGYKKMSETMQSKAKSAYFQTSLLINEMINLDYDLVSNLIKVKEKSGMRKDRFSSLLYNNYVVDQLKLQKKRRPKNTKKEIQEMFTVRNARSVKRF